MHTTLTFHGTKAAFDLPQLIGSMTAREQGFTQCIDDDALVASITEYAQRVAGQFDDIVLLGIGGSALGPRTLQAALQPHAGTPRLHIADNIDPDLVQRITNAITLKRTLFLVITKSGNTAETLSLFSYFEQLLQAQNLPVADHCVCLTDPTEGFLRAQVERLGVAHFPIPPNVGGRFSVLTAVGLLVGALLSLDLGELLAGARTMRDALLNENPDENPAYQLAAWQFQQYDLERRNSVMMPYVARLGTFCEWYAQLLAESTGKINRDGRHVGLTPLRALGVTDQHSQLQLYAQGPDDKHYLFVTHEPAHDIEIPELPTHEKTNMLRDTTFGQLLAAEYAGTRDTLLELGRPVCEVHIGQLNARTLGELFLLFEGATALLGEMLQINAFNQPGVERSKILTREYLAR